LKVLTFIGLRLLSLAPKKSGSCLETGAWLTR
jgi:hypothetical protein